MSESLTRLQAQFAGALHETIGPDVEQLNGLSQLASVQQFCTYNARFQIDTTATTPEEYFGLLMRQPEPQIYTPAEVAEQLTVAGNRLDTFVEGITSAYTYRKRLLPAENEAQRNAILAKVFGGGLAKITEYMAWSGADTERVTSIHSHEQMNFLPVSLLLLGARLVSAKHYEQVTDRDDSLEATASQEVIDASIDDALKEACLTIQQNKKMAIPKDAPDDEKAFIAAMNCLRTTYNMHQDNALMENLLAMYHPAFGDTSRDDPNDSLATYQNFRAYFAKLIGAEYPDFRDPKTAHLALLAAQKKGRILYDRPNYLQISQDLEYKIRRTQAAHWLVDNIADGTMRYSDIRKAMMLLNSQPLKQPESPTSLSSEATLPEEQLNWRILPPDIFDDNGNPRVGEGPQDPDLTSHKLDWGRLWRLQQYGRSWNGARFARSNIPDLPEEQQYYAVILPDITADGAYVEHAIADRPETDSGMYVWRGEVGIKDGHISLTWEHVLAEPRMKARKLGARCLYHTPGLETNLLDYLTRRPEQLASKRYAKL